MWRQSQTAYPIYNWTSYNKVCQSRTSTWPPPLHLSSTKSMPSLNEPHGGGDMPTLGEKIRKIRKDKGLTLEKLGELTESSKSYIWELENKNPPRPSADKIAKIAAVLGVTADYLVDEDESASVPDAVDQ